MAARLVAKEHVLSGTLTQASSIYNPQQIFPSVLTIRAGKANVGTFFWGNSDLTAVTNRGGFLDPGEAVAIDVTNKFIDVKELYWIGTASDIIHITTVF